MKELLTRIESATHREAGSSMGILERLSCTAQDSAQMLFKARFVVNGQEIRLAMDRVSCGAMQLPALDRVRPRRAFGTSLQKPRVSTDSHPRGTPGLLAIALPTPEGELSRFVTSRTHELGAAGDRRILWETIGDPRLSDAIYRQQAAGEPKTRRQARVANFLKAVGEWGTEENYVNGQYRRILAHFKMQSDELPLVLFVAMAPVYAYATLHLNVSMFETARRRQALAASLCQDTAQSVLLRYAKNDVFTAASMIELQDYFDFLKQTLQVAAENAEDDHIKNLPADYLERVLGDAPAEAPPPHAYVRSHRGGRTPLSEDEYRTTVNALTEYDFVIDGVGLTSCRRQPGTTEHRRGKLTPSEFKLLMSYVKNPGFHHPSRFHYAGASKETAQHAFHVARGKVDEWSSRYNSILFDRRPEAEGGASVYSFSPKEGTTWLVIEPSRT